jgi:hypothetical protein
MPRGGTELPDDPSETSDELRAEALRARLHAFKLTDAEAADRLRDYADELDSIAASMERRPGSLL